MSQKRHSGIDDLIANYYGSGSTDPDPRKGVADLLKSYYGVPDPSSTRRSRLHTVALSLGSDDGEVLAPARGSTPPARRTNGPSGTRGSSQTPTPSSVARPTATSLDFEEYVIDVCDGSDADRAPAAPVSRQTPVAAPRPEQPAAAPSQNETASSLSISPSNDDIVRDLQAIIKGQKVYDKEYGMIDRASAPKNAPAAAPSAPAPTQPVPTARNGQEIFDRIAQSMQYANAYDLGTVELENRFADFDRQEDQRRKNAAAAKKPSPRTNGGTSGAANGSQTPIAPAPRTSAPATSTAASIGTAEFLSDLDAMQSQTATPVFSAPFYDTGEHVLAANGAYAGRLHVGKGQTVAMSYGQIIAMGDLYESVDQMMAADADELNRLKALIARSTAFYDGKKQAPGLDVGNDEWNQATVGGRYLKLAEDNYEHFSPAYVAMGGPRRTIHGDNRSQWEQYHRRAIEAAQQEWLASSGNVSIFFEWPLTINAFGDHFLTDAFAAGHLINKEVMIDRFKNNFYSSGSLNSAGEQFFEKVANASWQGEVARRFSQLETVDWAHWHGIPLPFHPDIDSASRFGEVLKAAANQQPDRVANLIVKALHDRLNDEGIEVTNRAGDGTWVLPGDGSLVVGKGRLTASNLTKNLGVIRKAVQQSIDDINSPTIRADNLDFQKYFDGVWRYVPELTPSSQQSMTGMIRDYTDPASRVLVNAASDILTKQLKSFIQVMLDEHKLQPA